MSMKLLEGPAPKKFGADFFNKLRDAVRAARAAAGHAGSAASAAADAVKDRAYSAAEAAAQAARPHVEQYLRDSTTRKRVYDAARIGGTAIGAIQGARKGHIEDGHTDLGPQQLKKRKLRDRTLGGIAGALRGYSRGHFYGGGELYSGGLSGVEHGKPLPYSGVNRDKNTLNPRDILHTAVPDVLASAVNWVRKDKRYMREIGRRERAADVQDLEDLSNYEPELRRAVLDSYRAGKMHDPAVLRKSQAYNRPLRAGEYDGDLRKIEELKKEVLRLGGLLTQGPRATGMAVGLHMLGTGARNYASGGGSTSAPADPSKRGAMVDADVSSYIPEAARNDVGVMKARAALKKAKTPEEFDAALKKLVRQLSMYTHPDRGGSMEAQKRVNQLSETYKYAAFLGKTASGSRMRNAQKLRGLIESYLRQQPAQG